MISTGGQIRAARAALRWSQEDLAEHAGIHAKSVAYWERQERIKPLRSYARAPGRMLAALRSAGIDTIVSPRPAIMLCEGQ